MLFCMYANSMIRHVQNTISAPNKAAKYVEISHTTQDLLYLPVQTLHVINRANTRFFSYK